MTMPAESDYILLLPESGAAARQWWQVIGATGQDHEPAGTLLACAEPAADVLAEARVLVLVSSALAPVRDMPMPAMPVPQALAAERLAVPAFGGEADHCAVGLLDEADGARLLSCRVAAATMAGWLATCDELGVRPSALLPAALVLPRPGEGLVQAWIGQQGLARSPDAAFAAEPALIAALGQGGTVHELDAAALQAALLAAFAAPALDLRQGAFAPPRVSLLGLIDWQRLGRVAALCLLAVLALMVARIARWTYDADRYEAQAIAAAQRHVGPVPDLASAERLLRAEQARRGVGGAGFAAPVAAVLRAMRPVPSLTLRDLVWTDDGVLHVTAAAPQVEDVNRMLVALQRDGWAVTVPPAPVPDPTGAIIATLTVRAP